MVSDIFSKPILIEGIGHIFPIQMKHYDEFMDMANLITISINHFDVKEEYKNEVKLLDLLILHLSQFENRYEKFEEMSKLFSIVLRKKVNYFFNEEEFIFYLYSENDKNELDSIITRDNYDEVRHVIMKQNLLFEPKVFKSKIKQEWAEMVLKARAKNSIDMGIEDMITTIAAVSGKHYWDLDNYTIYQIKAEFARIGKLKSFDTNLALIGHSDKISNMHFAEKTDIHENPYDTIFVENKTINKLEKPM